MARDLARRIGALENGNGTIGIGDVLDAISESGISFRDPRTWPAAWVGKTIDPALLRSLDSLEPAFMRYETEEIQAQLSGRA